MQVHLRERLLHELQLARAACDQAAAVAHQVAQRHDLLRGPDLDGKSGQAILEAILAGQRDPHRLAELCDCRCKTPRAQVEAAMEGDSTGRNASSC